MSNLMYAVSRDLRSTQPQAVSEEFASPVGTEGFRSTSAGQNERARAFKNSFIRENKNYLIYKNVEPSKPWDLHEAGFSQCSWASKIFDFVKELIL